MTGIENDNKPNIEDKDYGFPFVEVTPLVSNVFSDKKGTVESDTGSLITPEVEVPVTPQIPKPLVSSIKIKSDKKSSGRKKSQLPLLMSLVFLIVIILGAIAYFLYYLPESEKLLQSSSPISSEEMIAEEQVSDIFEESYTEEEIDDSVSETVIDVPTVTPTVEAVTGEIIVVDSRGEIPYYNVIIASSPNERIARTEAQKIIDKGRSVWIIFPFGNTNNYRISVGRYEDLESATKAMEVAKVELNESSWILKY
jgi:cytoskeletal protein RodZ